MCHQRQTSKCCRNELGFILRCISYLVWPMHPYVHNEPADQQDVKRAFFHQHHSDKQVHCLMMPGSLLLVAYLFISCLMLKNHIYLQMKQSEPKLPVNMSRFKKKIVSKKIILPTHELNVAVAGGVNSDTSVWGGDFSEVHQTYCRVFPAEHNDLLTASWPAHDTHIQEGKASVSSIIYWYLINNENSLFI